MRQWSFFADMNHDGVVTISDVWLWFKWLYFYPGDLALQGMLSYLPGFATFFEGTGESFGGWGSGIFSFFVWFALLAVLGFMQEYTSVSGSTPKLPGGGQSS